MTLQQTFDLALQHHQAGRLRQAEQLYRQILAQQPDHPNALHFLGIVAAQSGDQLAAADLIRRAIELQPANADAHSNLGNVLKKIGQLDQACAAYRQAIALRNDFAEAHFNLGISLKALGRLGEAIVAYRQAITLQPNLAEAFNNLGIALRENGQLSEAIAAYRRAIALKPTYAEAFYNTGIALQEAGHLDEAAAVYRHAILLKPDYADALGNLAIVLKRLFKIDEALAACRQTLAVRPEYPPVHITLGSLLSDCGQVQAAIEAYRTAVRLTPEDPVPHGNVLLGIHYSSQYDPVAIRNEHDAWSRDYAEPLRQFIPPHANDRSPHRRLRIGYVSPDLRDHAVGRFLLPLLAHHDKCHVEVFAYAQVPAPDDMTEKFRAHIDHWRSLVGLSDQQAAELIHNDRIDILVDLAGHTAGNRLLVFARKPAPVQVTYLGYPDTTGLTAIDYRLTDAFADPPGLTESYHSEQLLRLARCAWCYQPLPSPPVLPRTPGPITFGCFNNFAKVTPPMLVLWARILRAVPDSRLLLKAIGLASESTRARVTDLLRHEGIDRSRLELHGFAPGHEAHMALYGRIDIALDTFPYHGTSTTCEALWMGAPVLTLAGPAHVSRVGVSLLTNTGLPELVARSEEEYVQLAAALAADLPRLADLRATLRQRMQQSPLMDAPRFARAVEVVYRQIWTKWCSTPAP